MDQRSLLCEQNIKYEERTRYIIVSSIERDLETFPDPCHYSVTLSKELRNISHFELIQAVLPDKQNVLDEPYLLLHIEEIEDVMESTNRSISDSFAIIQLNSPNVPGGFISTDKSIFENTAKQFRTPKASLTKLTITITDFQGRPFNFRGSPPIPSNDKSIQNIFVFKAVVLEKSTDVLNYRTVY